jgi:hypothetical protein
MTKNDEQTMTSKSLKIAAGIAAALIGTSGPLQAATAQPSAAELTGAVNHYLSEHGELCVGKFTWPRVVTQEDRQAHTNDAVQLPVLERLGLVESSEISVPAAEAAAKATQYSLTAKGRRYYLDKKHVTLSAHEQPVEHDKDLCVASLRLAKVVKWSAPEPVHGSPETVVRYTYHVKAADWMADPEARQVFPVADRIIRNQDNMLMSATVKLQDGKWVPVLPGQ